MKNVLSLRLDDTTLNRLRELAESEKKDVSSVARELIEKGFVLSALREYREGQLSLGSMAERLEVPLTDAIDLLAELGVCSPVEYDEYLASYSTAYGLVADSDSDGDVVRDSDGDAEASS